jgi:hypothetical protein
MSEEEEQQQQYSYNFKIEPFEVSPQQYQLPTHAIESIKQKEQQQQQSTFSSQQQQQNNNVELGNIWRFKSLSRS